MAVRAAENDLQICIASIELLLLCLLLYVKPVEYLRAWLGIGYSNGFEFW